MSAEAVLGYGLLCGGVILLIAVAVVNIASTVAGWVHRE